MGRMGLISSCIHEVGRKLFLQNMVKKCLGQGSKRGLNSETSHEWCIVTLRTYFHRVLEPQRIYKHSVDQLTWNLLQSHGIDKALLQRVACFISIRSASCWARGWRSHLTCIQSVERSIPGRYRLFDLCAVPANMPQGPHNQYEARTLRHVSR